MGIFGFNPKVPVSAYIFVSVYLLQLCFALTGYTNDIYVYAAYKFINITAYVAIFVILFKGFAFSKWIKYAVLIFMMFRFGLLILAYSDVDTSRFISHIGAYVVDCIILYIIHILASKKSKNQDSKFNIPIYLIIFILLGVYHVQDLNLQILSSLSADQYILDHDILIKLSTSHFFPFYFGFESNMAAIYNVFNTDGIIAGLYLIIYYALLLATTYYIFQLPIKGLCYLYRCLFMNKK